MVILYFTYNHITYIANICITCKSGFLLNNSKCEPLTASDTSNIVSIAVGVVVPIVVIIIIIVIVILIRKKAAGKIMFLLLNS